MQDGDENTLRDPGDFRSSSPLLDGQPRERLPLAWWLRIRWAGVIAVIVAGLTAQFALHLPLEPIPLAVLVALLAGSNLWLSWSLKRGMSPSVPLLGGVLVMDTLILTGVLYWTGGPSNPFSVFYLVHITLAVVVLPSSWTWAIVIGAVSCFGFLFFDHVPVGGGHGAHGGHDNSFDVHLQGMWVAFALAAVLIAWLVGRVQTDLRDREKELNRMQSLAARNERLAALTTLAGGAAHELATPLGTIAVAAGELEREALQGTISQEALLSDARLIRSETARCRSILDQMGARAGESISEPPVVTRVAELLENTVALMPEKSRGRIQVDTTASNLSIDTSPRALAQVLGGLVKNALEATPGVTPVELTAEARGDWIVFCVRDPGEGMAPEVLARVGEPFFTTKAHGQGMGLGLFLARLFAERLGGQLNLESEPGRGTVASLKLPRRLNRDVFDGNLGSDARLEGGSHG